MGVPILQATPAEGSEPHGKWDERQQEDPPITSWNNAGKRRDRSGGGGREDRCLLNEETQIHRTRQAASEEVDGCDRADIEKRRRQPERGPPTGGQEPRHWRRTIGNM